MFVLAFRSNGLLIVEELRTWVFVVRRKKLESTKRTLFMQPVFVNPAQEDQELQKSHPLESNTNLQLSQFACLIVSIALPHCNIQSHRSS
ncbi:hypothetical protein FVER53590_30387 [Fusarium verticillioides]|nr:hypothetical protein FVER53590_30387 [Fusarium verticillioides]